MNRFIEVTRLGGKKILVNLDHVIDIHEPEISGKNVTVILLSSCPEYTILVEESYEDIKKKILIDAAVGKFEIANILLSEYGVDIYECKEENVKEAE